jgi:hypothetical protein
MDPRLRLMRFRVRSELARAQAICLISETPNGS